MFIDQVFSPVSTGLFNAFEDVLLRMLHVAVEVVQLRKQNSIHKKAPLQGAGLKSIVAIYDLG